MKEDTIQSKLTEKKKIKLFKGRKKKGSDEATAIQYLQAQYDQINPDVIKSFKDFPLSQKTLKGLKENHFVYPTDIQKQSIGFALQGKDILGAAKTGSGKTLAFLIPILEHLFCKKWTRMDGLGVIVLSPTRELAYQIYETLRKIGHYHDFSAGLIIGGQNLKFERKRMDQMNILICTPGRLLQHMDENPLFDCSHLEILVLDEADRCLDMGFSETMNAIIENLPPNRQTMLFSATQTKSVKDLARLSLSFPTYVAPHEQSSTTTPDSLQQSYIVCEVHEKLAILWSFIRNHLKHKILVFMSTCKQVKYIYDLFCKLRPGVSLLALYGTLHQEKREKIYQEFCRKSNVVLFATDLASRGLDFPKVNWVIQLDCPEDVDTYIHRAGRTARGISGKGEGLLVLMPHEECFVEDLKARKIPINKINVDPSKVIAPQRKIEALLSEYPDLKQTAQRAFISYIKSMFLMKNKKIFDIQKIDTDAYSRSLGLIVSPRIRFLNRFQKKVQIPDTVNIKEDVVLDKIKSKDNDDEASNDSDYTVDKTTSNEDKKDINQGKKKYEPLSFGFHDESDDEEFLQVKHKSPAIGSDYESGEDIVAQPETSKPKKKKPLTKAAIAKKIMKKKLKVNTQVKFTEDGEVVADEKRTLKSDLAKEYENDDVGGIDIEKAKEVLKEEDKFDKQRFREKVKAKHKEIKRKLSNRMKDDQSNKDEFGSDSESDGPDLSWLPDPDKIYKGIEPDDCKNKEDYKSGSDSTSEDISQVHKPNKRKLVKKKGTKEENFKPRKHMKLKDVTSSLSMNEAEALAMQLLKK